MKNILKKITYLLQLFDGLWSVPLAFLTFWFVGIVLQSCFGYETGTYDAGFIQPLFLAAAVVIGATNIAVIGIFFTFRGLYRYLYGHKDPSGKRIIRSRQDWFTLPTSQRFLIAFGVFFFFVIAVITVYLKLV